MATVTPRRCALALLCALLALVTARVHAESITVSSSVTMLNTPFDGHIISFDMATASENVVMLQILDASVSGNGLTFESATAGSVSARLGMSMVSTTVQRATITFSGAMPSGSDIRIVSTSGTLAAAQSLFEFSGLALDKVTVTVEDTTVQWPEAGTNTGSALLISAGSSSIGITNFAALFVLGVTANHGASVVRIEAQSPFVLENNAMFTVDYSTCNACSDMLVDIRTPFVVSGTSLFRVSNSKATGAVKGLLSTAGSTTVRQKSAYIIDTCETESGTIFSFPTVASPSNVPYSFAVSDDSLVSILGVSGPSTGLDQESPLPSPVDASSRVIAGTCKINGKALADKDAYTANGIRALSIVNVQGVDVEGTMCANAKCVPGNTEEGFHAPIGEDPCTCQCTNAQYMPPYCTASVDPIQSYSPNVECELEYCASCDRLNPKEKCLTCLPGYTHIDASTCGTAPTPTSPSCTASYCTSCVSGSASQCSTCQSGYHLSNGSCIRDANAAAGARSAVLAAVACVAATLYVL